MGTRQAGSTAAIFTAVVMVAQLVASSATRDALFLSHFDVTSLPAAIVASALLSVAYLPLLTGLLGRFGPGVVTRWAGVASALLLMGEWLAGHHAPRVAAAAFFIHVSVLGATLVSGFWSLTNERFDPHTAKHLMGRIAGGATLGGVLGGLAAARLGAAGIEPLDMLPLVAATQIVGVVGLRWLATPGRPEATPAQDPASREGSTLRLLAGTPYLRGIALLVALIAFVSTIAGYLVKAEASRSFAQGGELLRFFAVYYLALGVLAFVFQIGFSRLSLTRLGLGATVAVLPAALVVGAVGVLVVPGLWSAAALRAADDVFTNSLYRSGYELLYTPIAPARKRRIKALIDLGFDRLGKTLGGGLVMLVVWAYSDNPVRLLAALCVAGALGGLLLATRLHRGYVGALEESLRTGAVSLGAGALLDATTRQTLVAATGGVDRMKVLEAMRGAPEAPAPPGVALSDGDSALWGTQVALGGLRAPEASPEEATPDAAKTLARALRGDRLLEQIAQIRGGEAERVRELLDQTEPLDPHLVPHAISLLARDDLYRDAIRALRKVARRSTGQLVDALLDPATDPVIRRRLPPVLAAAPSRIAVDGLLQTLGDKGFDLRYRSALALARIRAADPSLVIPPEVVFEAASREIDRGKRIWKSHGLTDDPEDAMGSPLVEDFLRNRSSRGLELVFTILSLGLEPEPLKLAYRALGTEDQKLRGTALEYLETVLPEGLRAKLWPYVDARPRGARSATDREQALSELMQSSDTITVEVEALRRRLRKDDQAGGKE